MLEIRHLRTLSALRSAGSLVRAAQLLNLTQSALSHQIKLLEDRYGGPLFERKSVPIGFTATGARLLKLADLLLPEIEAAEREVARLTQGDTGQLRVALECHTCFDWLMPVMDEFRKRWPDVEIDLVSGFHSEPAELLRSGAADLVIGSPYGPDFVTFPLFRYEILVVMAQKHRLAMQRRLHPADFEGETLITYPVPETRIDLIREVLQPVGIRVDIVFDGPVGQGGDAAAAGDQLQHRHGQLGGAALDTDTRRLQHFADQVDTGSVSYTHLTLPTKA